jgi:hypothetical protein
MKKILFLLFLMSLFSCEDIDNYDKISKDYHYTGSFSIPIGNARLGMTESGKNLPPDWETNPFLLAKLSYIRFSDSIPFDFNYSIGTAERIKQLIFTVNIVDSFPSEVAFQAYIANGNKIIVDSLFSGKFVVPKANVSANGDVVSSGIRTDTISVSKQRVEKWQLAKYILFEGYMQNDPVANKPLYQYYDKLKMNVAVGVQLDFDFNTNTIK